MITLLPIFLNAVYAFLYLVRYKSGPIAVIIIEENYISDPDGDLSKEVTVLEDDIVSKEGKCHRRQAAARGEMTIY